MARPVPVPPLRLKGVFVCLGLLALAAVDGALVVDALSHRAVAMRGGMLYAADEPIMFTVRVLFMAAIGLVIAGAGLWPLVDALLRRKAGVRR